MNPEDEEKEYGNKPMITELDPESDKDEVAVYGADDEENFDSEGDQDDVVTSDEVMDDEGDDVDLSSEVDFDDDEEPVEDDEFSDDEDLDDEIEGEGGDEMEQFRQFKELIKSIVQSDNPDLEEDDVDAAVEEAVNYYLNEDASFSIAMNKHAKRKSVHWEPSDVDELIEDLRYVEGNEININANGVQSNQYYHVVRTMFEDSGVRVYNIVNKFDLSNQEKVKSFVANENRDWKSFYSNLVDQFDPSTAQSENPEAAETKFKELKSLKREHLIFSGKKVKNIIAEAQQNSNIHVIAGEELKGESFVSNKGNISEADAKSLAGQTRKTHSVKTDDKVYDGFAILKDMAGVIFGGKVKAWSDPYKVKTPQGGFKGSQAKARRGDKRNGPDKTADKLKAEAAITLLSKLEEMSDKQLKAFISAFDETSDIRTMVQDSIDYNFQDDFEALQTVAEGEGLSEAFLNDTKLIFETTVKSKLDAIVENIAVNLSQKHDRKVKSIQNAMINKLDEYLDYFADQFMEENRLAIEEGQRVEISQNILEGMFNVLRENNVDVPEGKENILEKAKAEKAKAEEALQEAHNLAMAYKKKAVSFMKKAIIAEHQKGLTVKEQNELERKAQAITEFKGEEDFEKQVKDIKRIYFSENKKTINKNNKEFDTLVESSEYEDNGTPMDKYAEALDKQLRAVNYNKKQK